MSTAARSLFLALVATLLLVLAPGMAGAHGGHAHEDAAPAAVQPDETAERPAAAAADALSPPSHGKPGKSCGCGGGAGCHGDGRIAMAPPATVVVAPRAVLPLAPGGTGFIPSFRVLPSASPRGPPQLS